MDVQNRTELEAYVKTHAGSQLRLALADLYLQENMLNDAMAMCQKVIAENPGSPYGYFLLAQAEINAGDVAAALEYLKQAVDLDTGFLSAYYLMLTAAREQLSPEARKACYGKIIELNPYDENARAEFGRIAENPDRDFLKNIRLPEIKIQQTTARNETETKTAPEENTQTAEAEEKPVLSEEEAHLGPPEATEEEEPAPNIAIEPEPQLEAEDVEDWGSEPEEPATTAEPAPEEEEISTEPEQSAEAKTPPQAPPPTAAEGQSAAALSDMFAKLKSKPLDEVQKENWSLPVVEAPEGEENQNSLYKRPNVKYTVPLKEKKDERQDFETIRQKVPSPPDEKRQTPEVAEAEPPKKAVKKPTPDASAKKDVQTEAENGGKMELKIPVPTFTLVEVFKKQKLYDEALQLLDVLEKKSKNPERIEKERREIIQLKMEAE